MYLTVYLIQDPHFARDLRDAERFGEIVTLLDRQMSPSLLPAPSLLAMRNRLRNFNEERDYILHAGGDPYAVMLVGIALTERNCRSVRFLKWDRDLDQFGERTRQGRYIPMELKLR